MLEKIQYSQWSWMPVEKGSPKRFEFSIPHGGRFEMHVRSFEPVDVFCGSKEGEILPLARVTFAHLRYEFSGYDLVFIEAGASFGLRLVGDASAFLEQPDPTPITVSADVVRDPVRDLVAVELRKQLVKLKLEGLFESDEEVEELMRDFEEGDLDDDEEPDIWSLTSAAEKAEEDALAARRAEQEDAADEVEQEEAGSSPASAAPAEKAPGSAPAAK